MGARQRKAAVEEGFELAHDVEYRRALRFTIPARLNISEPPPGYSRPIRCETDAIRVPV